MTANNLGVISFNPRWVVSLKWDDETHYFTTHSDVSGITAVDANATIFPAMLDHKFAALSQSINPVKAQSTVGSVNVKLIDRNSAISNLLRSKLAADQTLKDRLVKVYEGDASQPFSDYKLFGTWRVVGDSQQKANIVLLKCEDVLRESRKTIFQGFEAELAQSLTINDNTISVSTSKGLSLIQHDQFYGLHPNKAVNYLKIGDNKKFEIIAIDQINNLSIRILERGCFNTQRLEFSASDDSGKRIKIRVREFVYLEGNSVDLALQILTGQQVSQPGKTLPDSWHLGIDMAWIDLASFTQSDLWDSVTESGVMLRFDGETKQNGRRFIDGQLMFPTGAYLKINKDGKIAFHQASRVLRDSQSIEILDYSNVIKYGDVEHDYNQVYKAISLKWQYDGVNGYYQSDNVLVDIQSATRWKNGKTLNLELRGLHGTRHTYSTIKTLFDNWRDRSAAPPHTQKITLLPSMSHLNVGDIVYLKQDHRKDYLGNDTVSRAVEIQSTSRMPNGLLEVTVFGSTQTASPLPNEDNSRALPDEWYISEGTNLLILHASKFDLSVPGLAKTTAPFHLTGTANLRDAGSIFYIDRDVQFDHKITFENNVQLRVNGTRIHNAHFDGSGLGLAEDKFTYTHASQADKQDAYLSLKPFTGQESFLLIENPALAADKPWAELKAGRNRSNYKTKNRGRNECVVPDTQIVSNTLTSLPKGLSGQYGYAGQELEYVKINNGVEADSVIKNSNTPGRGGAGLMVISQGVSFGLGGKILTNGQDAQGTTQYHQYAAKLRPDLTSATNKVRAGSSSGGAPGCIIELIDAPLLLVGDYKSESKHGAYYLPSDLYISNANFHRFDPRTNVNGGISHVDSVGSWIVGWGNSATSVAYEPDVTESARRLILLSPEVETTASVTTPSLIETAPTIDVELDQLTQTATVSVNWFKPSGNYSHAVVYWRIEGKEWQQGAAGIDAVVFDLALPSASQAYELEIRSVGVNPATENETGIRATFTVGAQVDDAPNVLSLLLTQSVNLPVSRDGSSVTINAIAAAPVSDDFDYAVFDYRISPVKTWTEMSSASELTANTVLAANEQSVEVRARSVNTSGKVNQAGLSDTIAVKKVSLPVPNVAGLRQKEGYSITTFDGRSVSLLWKKLSLTGGSDLFYGNTGKPVFTDEHLAYYRIKVFAGASATGTPIATYESKSESFDYSKDLMNKDKAPREITFEIVGVSTDKTVSEIPAKISVNNPAMATPQFTVTKASTNIELAVAGETDNDSHFLVAFVCEGDYDNAYATIADRNITKVYRSLKNQHSGVLTFTDLKPNTQYSVFAYWGDKFDWQYAAPESYSYGVINEHILTTPSLNWSQRITTDPLNLDINNLALADQSAGALMYNSKRVELTWDELAIGDQLEHFQVKIFAGASNAGTLQRTETVKTARFEYSTEQMNADNSARQLTFEVIAVSKNSGSSNAAASITVNNPDVPVPTLFTSAGANDISIKASSDSVDNDYFVLMATLVEGVHSSVSDVAFNTHSSRKYASINTQNDTINFVDLKPSTTYSLLIRSGDKFDFQYDVNGVNWSDYVLTQSTKSKVVVITTAENSVIETINENIEVTGEVTGAIVKTKDSADRIEMNGQLNQFKAFSGGHEVGHFGRKLNAHGFDSNCHLEAFTGMDTAFSIVAAADAAYTRAMSSYLVSWVDYATGDLLKLESFKGDGAYVRAPDGNAIKAEAQTPLVCVGLSGGYDATLWKTAYSMGDYSAGAAIFAQYGISSPGVMRFAYAVNGITETVGELHVDLTDGGTGADKAVLLRAEREGDTSASIKIQHFEAAGSPAIITNQYPTSNLSGFLGDPATAYAMVAARDIYRTNEYTLSDIRAKYDVRKADSDKYIDAVMQFKLKTFRYKSDSNAQHKNLGLIAQQVQKVLPEMILDDGKNLQIKSDMIPMMLIATVQKQQKTIESLIKRLEKLEHK